MRSPTLGSSDSNRRCRISRLPMITPSILLKSWAMPPVSWPSASIFCDWRRISSALSRSSLSRTSAASASTRSVRSWVSLANPCRSPPSSRIAVISTPALCRRTSITNCGLEETYRYARLNIFAAVKAGKVTPDDLLGTVALHTLGASVPVDHPALGVDHEDRIVFDSGDHQTKALLAFAQRRLRA